MPVESRLVFAKVLLFSLALSSVGWTRFQNNVLLERGISVRDVGILKGLGLLFKLIGELVCCVIADKHDPFRVFIVCALVQAYTLECIRSSSTLTFNYVLYVKFLRGVTACLPTLTNTLVVALTIGTKEGYGHQRVFGSIAWGVGALCTGFLIDNYGTNALFLFAYIFYGIAAVLMYIGSSQLIVQHGQNSKHSNSPRSPNKAQKECNELSTGSVAAYCQFVAMEIPRLMHQLRDSLSKLLSSGAMRLLLFNILMYGVVMSSVDSVIFTSLIRDYHTSASFGGMYTGMGVLSCLPAFYLSSALIDKHGHYNILRFAQVACIVRLSLNCLLPSSWEYSPHCLLCTQLIHGACFALFWSAAIDVMYKLAPVDMKNVALGILNALYFTIGGAIGNIMWSFLLVKVRMHGVLVCAAVLTCANVGLLQLNAPALIQQIELVTSGEYAPVPGEDTA